MAQDVSVLYGIKDAGDLTFTNLTTNKPELYIGYANSVQIDLTSDTVYAYAKGAKAVSWDKPLEGTMKISVDLMSFDLMGFIMGSKLSEKATEFYKRETFKLKSADEEVTLSATPSEIKKDTVCVYELGADKNSQGAELSTATCENVNTDGKITMTGGTEGKTYVVYYMTTKTAKTFMVEAESTLSAFYKLNMITFGKAWADGGKVPMEIEFLKVSPQRSLSLTFSAEDPSSFEINLDILADGEGNLFEIKNIA